MRHHSFISTPWMQAALDAAIDGIIVEAAERVVYVNASYASMLGYRRPHDLVSRPIIDLIADSDADRLLRFGRMRMAGQRVPSAYDFSGLRSDASTVRLQASVSMTLCGGASYITTIVRPVAGTASAPDSPIAGPHDQLSPRERQVMEMILAGKRAKVVALELELTESTVATHRVRLLEKIGVADNRELYQYALRHRLVDWS